MASDTPPYRVLFVCTGNICRSPTAEGIARVRAAQAGLDVQFDSAGTHDYHVGEAPDSRSCVVARKAGTPIDDLRAWRIGATDFTRFNLILAADRGHLRALQRLRPADSVAQLDLLLAYAGVESPVDVPDPYYGPMRGFGEVYELLERAVAGLLQRLVEEGMLDRRGA